MSSSTVPMLALVVLCALAAHAARPVPYSSLQSYGLPTVAPMLPDTEARGRSLAQFGWLNAVRGNSEAPAPTGPTIIMLPSEQV